MAERQDYQYFRGEDKKIRVTITGLDITGWDLAFTVRPDFDLTAVITKTTGGGGISVTDGANGVLEITMDADDTASLVCGPYVFDVVRTGTKTVLTYGEFKLLPNVT